MSTIPTSKIDLEKYVNIYGSFHEDEKQKACELALETVIKVIQAHADSIKELKNPYEAGSYFLDYVEEVLKAEEGEIARKLQSYVEELFSQKDPTEFATAIEWGAIDCLKDLFKQHRI